MKIVILDGYTTNPGDNPWTSLESLGELEVYDRTPEDLIVERSKNADIIFANKAGLSAEVLKQLPQLKFICVLATGYNIIDLKTANEMGIVVSNVPGYSPPAVSQHVFALILEFYCRVGEHDQDVKNGKWAQSQDFCFWNSPLFELKDKTLGIIGFGDIGHQVARLGNAFGMNVLAYAPRPKPMPDFKPFAFADLEDVFAQSDIVSLHCPLTDGNRHFIDKSLLKKMKPEAILINTARGPLINEHDLAEALSAKTIAGAGLDVAEVEPMPADNPLLKAPNTIITPHIAWATIEARKRLTAIAVKNAKAFIAGTPENVVNSPKK
jgi:glycerate dehydrogenase